MRGFLLSLGIFLALAGAAPAETVDAFQGNSHPDKANESRIQTDLVSDGQAVFSSTLSRHARSSHGLPGPAEWPGAPCVTDADCGELQCCNGVCAESCNNAAPLRSALHRQTRCP